MSIVEGIRSFLDDKCQNHYYGEEFIISRFSTKNKGLTILYYGDNREHKAYKINISEWKISISDSCFKGLPEYITNLFGVSNKCTEKIYLVQDFDVRDIQLYTRQKSARKVVDI